MLTGVSKASDNETNNSESGTDKPCSHFEIVCLTTFNFIANSSCESPFDFLIVLILSFNIIVTSFTKDYMLNLPLLQATHINMMKY